MSDRSHSNPEDLGATEMLHRAAELSPAMSVEPQVVLAKGRRKARRRSSAVGAGAFALAGALWLGGPLNPFASTDPLVPASVDWQDGVDVALFDNQPHSSEVGRTHWTGELRSAEGDTQPELVLTRDGVQLEPIRAEDGPGEVMVFLAEDLAVAAWQSPAGSLGEWPLWNPGQEAGQGSSVQIEGSELQYASAEFVPGAEPGLTELYWFSQDAGHAASGAPVDSAVLTAGESTSVVMIDEARQAWGTGTELVGTAGDRSIHVERLVSGAGLTGWAGAVDVPASVGVLPPGASVPAKKDSSGEIVQDTLGSHTIVLTTDSTSTMTAPTIQFSIDGSMHTLANYVAHEAKTLTVAGRKVQVDGTPDGLQLIVAPERLALLPSEELDGDSAVLGSVANGHLVIVPAWEPNADVDELRVQVGSDAKKWVPVDSALSTTLFDGTPLVALSLDADTLDESETIHGVGAVVGDDIVPHELEDGIRTGNFDF